MKRAPWWPSSPGWNMNSTRPGDLVAARRQQPGRTGEHRHVGVVPAGVHRAVAARAEVEPGVLVQRQGVHVAAQQHRRTRLAAGEHAPRSRSWSRAAARRAAARRSPPARSPWSRAARCRSPAARGAGGAGAPSRRGDPWLLRAASRPSSPHGRSFPAHEELDHDEQNGQELVESSTSTIGSSRS